MDCVDVVPFGGPLLSFRKNYKGSALESDEDDEDEGDEDVDE